MRWLDRLVCRLFYHQLVTVHRCSPEAEKVECIRCGAQFGMHHGEHIALPWTEDLCICRDLEAITRRAMAK